MPDNLQNMIRLNDAQALKEIEQAVIQQSVVDFPDARQRSAPVAPIVFNIAQQADEFVPWGYDLKARDAQLRSFFPSQPLLSSAVYSMAVRMGGMEWDVIGADQRKPSPRGTIYAAKQMLKNADRGQGWQKFMVKLMTDVYTQDNAGFIEMIRVRNRPDSPVIGIAHLDSFSCYRTGDPEMPVIYKDRRGREHKMAWWNIQTVEDMPSPVESMYGAQL